MTRRRPGGPGDFDTRLRRTEQLRTRSDPAADRPLAALAAVLRYQGARFAALPPRARIDDGDRRPLPHLDDVAAIAAGDLPSAVEAVGDEVPEPLRVAGGWLRASSPVELAAAVSSWLDDDAGVEPRLAFWYQVAAGPVLEHSACGVAAPDDWSGRACPVCGGVPQASVIVEESGEFMAGSPRYLICSRCATSWKFPRATCTQCGEAGSRSTDSFLVDTQRWLRVDTCSVCRGYVKTFDLRQPGAAGVVPLVDDVGTLALDVWAHARGYARAARSVAGV